MSQEPAILLFSGGKDSSSAVHYSARAGYAPIVLLTFDNGATRELELYSGIRAEHFRRMYEPRNVDIRYMTAPAYFLFEQLWTFPQERMMKKFQDTVLACAACKLSMFAETIMLTKDRRSSLYQKFPDLDEIMYVITGFSSRQAESERRVYAEQTRIFMEMVGELCADFGLQLIHPIYKIHRGAGPANRLTVMMGGQPLRIEGTCLFRHTKSSVNQEVLGEYLNLCLEPVRTHIECFIEDQLDKSPFLQEQPWYHTI